MDPLGKIFPRSSLRGALAVFVGIVAGGLVGVAGAAIAVEVVVGVAAAAVVLGLTTACAAALNPDDRA